MNNNKNDKNKSSFLNSYLGLTFQFFTAIAIATFIGQQIDQYYFPQHHIAIWCLPTITIITTLISIIYKTLKK